MNIFVTDTCPILSAQALDDVRLNKMIVESAQLLSTALRIRGQEDPILYKLSHMHHPCCHWVRRTRGNFVWLLSHAEAMLDERRYRGANVEHMTSPVIKKCAELLTHIKPGGREPFHNSSMFKDNLNVVEAYRDTMRYKWEHDTIRVTWKQRGAPPWLNLQNLHQST